MEGQLRLVEPDEVPVYGVAPERQGSAVVAPRAWEIDDHTREVGRQGVASARQALRQAVSRTAA